MRKLAAVYMAISLAFPATAHTQETPSNEALFTHLEQNDPAPFAGTLFNPIAAAELIAEHQYSLTDCDLRIEFEIDKLEARYQLQIESLNASANAQNERLNLLLEAKDLEIDTYREMALEQPNKNNHWWLIGGFVTGAAASIGIFHAATQIAQ